MSNPRHPVWFILFCVVLLIPAGILYSSSVYHNGADLVKDSGLIGLIGTLTAGYFKVVNS